MSSSPIHVLIAGAGLGGLCLAQGLRQAGVSVAVYERDETPALRRQGYRIHIDARGEGGLRACLPSHLFDLFTATASPPSSRITILDKRLKTLRVIGRPRTEDAAPASFSAGVDRLTLREILLAGLDGIVSFGREFTRFELREDGGVRAFFADGQVAEGDVLVGADGVNSHIRQQFLPAAAVADTSARCIYGKVLLTEATRPLIPPAVHDGFTVAAGSQVSVALGLVEFSRSPAEAVAQFAPGVRLSSSDDYLMWSLNGRRGQFAASDDALFSMDGSALVQMVLRQISGWHPDLRALIAASDPAEIFPIAVRSSVPCEPWQSGPVTLLGDAIHAMSPAGGSGANMALLDASRLSQALVAIARGEQPLAEGLHAYEARMLTEGFEAVRFSQGGGALRANAGRPPLLQAILRAMRRG